MFDLFSASLSLTHTHTQREKLKITQMDAGDFYTGLRPALRVHLPKAKLLGQSHSCNSYNYDIICVTSRGWLLVLAIELKYDWVNRSVQALHFPSAVKPTPSSISQSGYCKWWVGFYYGNRQYAGKSSLLTSVTLL